MVADISAGRKRAIEMFQHRCFRVFGDGADDDTDVVLLEQILGLLPHATGDDQ